MHHGPNTSQILLILRHWIPKEKKKKKCSQAWWWRDLGIKSVHLMLTMACWKKNAYCAIATGAATRRRGRRRTRTRRWRRRSFARRGRWLGCRALRLLLLSLLLCLLLSVLLIVLVIGNVVLVATIGGVRVRSVVLGVLRTVIICRSICTSSSPRGSSLAGGSIC